ncbi:MAG TPA: hydroxyisourate hydrolase [Vicinamibacterales bacterium]|nr:hydroxyisourate hydrolase [Vicinamibacterales bacterium]
MTISTHVLDTSIGRPAASLAVELQRQDGASWIDVSHASTTSDGRVTALLPPGAVATPGAYRLSFDAGAYFESRGVESFYRIIVVDFIAADAASHYHVPLLLSPFGYSTYRGT